MTDRPAILSAKVERMGEVLADLQDLKAMPKSERPGEATLSEVRGCGGDCLRSVLSGHDSTASVRANTKLPSERLGGGS